MQSQSSLKKHGTPKIIGYFLRFSKFLFSVEITHNKQVLGAVVSKLHFEKKG